MTDVLSLSSVEDPTGDMCGNGNRSHEAMQPEVIDINDININDDSASVSEESIEEDPEAELGTLS